MNIYDTIGSLDEALQMSIIEVIRLDCKSDSSHRVSPFLTHSVASNETFV